MEFSDPNMEEEGDLQKGYNVPPLIVLLFLLLAVLLGSMIGGLIVYAWAEARGVDLQSAMGALGPESLSGQRNFMRTVNLISHLLTFTVPAIGVSYFLYRSSWLKALMLNRKPGVNNSVIGVLFLLCSFPLAQLTYWVNRQLPLPEWASSMENSAEGIIEGLLIMNSPAEFLLTLLVVAVLPAVGEELIFRGIVQRRLQEQFQNPVTAIWVTALIFSAIHLQFEGFLPRLMLGAVLGYLFYWTSNLWVAIIAHFALNGSQVVAQYLYGDQLKELQMENIDNPGWSAGLFSLMLLLFIGYYLRKINKQEYRGSMNE